MPQSPAIVTNTGSDRPQVALIRVAVAGDIMTVQLGMTGNGGNLSLKTADGSAVDDASTKRLAAPRDNDGRWMAAPMDRPGNYAAQPASAMTLATQYAGPGRTPWSIRDTTLTGEETLMFVVLFTDNPDRAEARSRLMSEHLGFLERHAKLVIAAGPLEDGNGRGAGGLWLVDAQDRDAVRQLVERDPLWPTGLRASVQILEWRRVFADGRRNHPA